MPKGYRYEIEKSKDPSGVVVTFTSPDPTVAPPYGTITIRAFVNAKSYLSAKRLFNEEIASGKLQYPEEAKNDPFFQTRFSSRS